MAENGQSIIEQGRVLAVEEKLPENQKKNDLINPNEKKSKDIFLNNDNKLEDDRNDKIDHDQSLFRFALIKRISDKYGIRLPVGTVLTKLIEIAKKGLRFAVPVAIAPTSIISSNQKDFRSEIKRPEITLPEAKRQESSEGTNEKHIDKEDYSGKRSEGILSAIVDIIANVVSAIVSVLTLSFLFKGKENTKDLNEKDKKHDLPKKEVNEQEKPKTEPSKPNSRSSQSNTRDVKRIEAEEKEQGKHATKANKKQSTASFIKSEQAKSLQEQSITELHPQK